MSYMSAINQSIWWKVGGVAGALSIATGAFGAHGIKSRVKDEKKLGYWQTASQYHLIHSVALMLAPLSKNPNAAGFCFATGIALFSGSLYTMTLSDKKLGMIPPIGGLAFIAGWIALIL